MTVTNSARQRAFKALTHAVIMSIFGDHPDVNARRTGRVEAQAIDELDGGIVQRGFDMVMLGHRPDLGLRSLQQSGWIVALMPDVERMVGFGGYEEGHKDLWEHTLRVVRNAPPRLEVRWAALFHDAGKPHTFKKRGNKVTFHGHELRSVQSFMWTANSTALFPDRDFRERVSAMIETLGNIESYRDDWTDSAVRRVRRRIEDDSVWRDLLDLARADVTSAHEDRRDRCRARTDELETRVAGLLREEDEASRLKLPKGTGTLVAERYGLSGAALGNALRILQSKIESGLLRPGLTPEAYAAAFVDFTKMV